MYDEGLHVPLVIAGPGIESGQIKDLIEHIDIAALYQLTPDCHSGLHAGSGHHGGGLPTTPLVYAARDR